MSATDKVAFGLRMRVARGRSPGRSGDAIVRLISACDPAALGAPPNCDGTHSHATPDAGRRIISGAEFVDAHFGEQTRPPVHSFGAGRRPY